MILGVKDKNGDINFLMHSSITLSALAVSKYI